MNENFRKRSFEKIEYKEELGDTIEIGKMVEVRIIWKIRKLRNSWKIFVIQGKYGKWANIEIKKNGEMEIFKNF